MSPRAVRVARGGHLPHCAGGLALPFFRSLPTPVFLCWGTPTHCALMRSCTVICAWEASSVQCFPLFLSLHLSLLCIMMMHCQELTTSSSLPLLSFFFIPSHSPLSFAFTYAVFTLYKVNYIAVFSLLSIIVKMLCSFTHSHVVPDLSHFILWNTHTHTQMDHNSIIK